MADSRVADLHLWAVGQGAWTMTASIVAHEAGTPEAYKAALADIEGLHHPIIEVHQCGRCPPRR